MPLPPTRYLNVGPGLPQANPSISLARADALSRMGATIAAVGEKGFQIAEKVRRNEEGGKISDFMRGGAVQASRFEESLLKRQDPENWRRDAEGMISGLRGELSGMKLSPEGLRTAREELENWATRQTIRLEGLAANRSLLESRAKFGNELKWQGDTGDMEQYRVTLQRGVAAGIIGGAEREQLEREGLRIATLSELSRRRQEDPKGLLEEVRKDDFVRNTPGVFEADREKLIRGLEADVQQRQKEHLQAISTAIETGEIQTEEELKRKLEKSPYIDEALHDEVLFNFQQRQPIDAETRFAISDQLNDLHDAYKNGELNLDEYRMAHDELAQIVYSFGARDGSGALRQRIHALDPAAWNGQNLQEAREQTREREIQKLSVIYQKAGAFGAVDEDEELPPFQVAEQEAEILRRRERVEQRMGEWLRDNPDGKDLDAQFRKVALDELSTGILSGGTPSTDDRRRSLDEMLGAPAGPPGARNTTPDRPVGGSLKAMVKQFEAGGEKEGFHREAYWDYGQWSIGYGTKAKQGEVIDRVAAEKRLDDELATHRKRVEEEARRVGMAFEEHELDALTSFDFNTGKIRQLLAGGTRSKAEIASKMLLYRKADGRRLQGLERRRIAESKLFRRGYTD